MTRTLLVAATLLVAVNLWADDPWKKPYQYDPSGPRNNGRRPDIWTVAPDGLEIGNWPKAPGR